MAHIIADRVMESSVSAGTGLFTLAGASLGYRAFGAVCAIGDTVPYYIEAVSSMGLLTGDWEFGLGTYSAAGQLTRTAVRGSSNGGAPVNFPAGTKVVGLGVPAPNSQATRAEWIKALGVDRIPGLRNRLINGGFGVNQLALSGAVILAPSDYGHDMWKAGAAGCVYTFAESDGVTTITITSGSISQRVEALNIEAGEYVLSWEGTSQGRLNNSGAYAGSSISAALPGGSIYVEFGPGTLRNVQLEPGTIPTAFDRRPVGMELSLCQRYFYSSYDGSGPGYPAAALNRRMMVASSSAVGGVQLQVQLPVRMRTAPTINFYNPTTGGAGSMRNESAGTDMVAALIGNLGPDSFTVVNGTAATAGNTYALHFTASART